MHFFIWLFKQYGFSPLHYAAMRGHTELVTLLLSRGADIEITNDVRM
jgi:ankyrin repeat protein